MTNSTYVDCPILPDTAEFVVTTYNPSTKPYEMQSFKVPPSTNYDVEVYDTSSSTWNKVQSTLLCYDFIENNEMLSTYEDCNLYVQAEGLPHHLTFMKVTASTEAAEDNSDDSS